MEPEKGYWLPEGAQKMEEGALSKELNERQDLWGRSPEEANNWKKLETQSSPQSRQTQ